MEKELKQPQVKTAAPVDSKNEHRLPHERDESDDSQSSTPRKDMKQAARDVTSGQVDTDARNRAGGVENVVQKAAHQSTEKK